MKLSKLTLIMSNNDEYDKAYFPPPLKLTRSYKALCTNCNTNITAVSNSERVGGICWNCLNSIDLQILIENIGTIENQK